MLFSCLESLPGDEARILAGDPRHVVGNAFRLPGSRPLIDAPIALEALGNRLGHDKIAPIRVALIRDIAPPPMSALFGDRHKHRPLLEPLLTHLLVLARVTPS